ncbi:synaptic vesicle transporter [Aureobasidium pullulans]|uniref:Synaptic vesicle transporter n=1 Tax=Aureobasidium pullulans TaxID=5580 RepID=A0A4S8YVR8_AURPU|nr:synaptic vesicle transporter [Aureobasidium pullulans]
MLHHVQPPQHHHGPSVSWFRLVYDQALVTPEVQNWKYAGSGTEEDPFVVVWIDNDPRNPMTWPDWQKWYLVALVSVATLAVAFVSSAYTGGLSEVIVQFQTSQLIVTLGVSLFVLGFAIGPLMWAPMSEIFGRQVLFIGTYAALTAFNAGAAGAQNITTLLLMRFFAGSFGSSPLTNAGGIIADMFDADQRGLAMTFFASAPFLGPVIGPIVGGFAGETIGWRWVEGIMAIFTGILWIAGSLLISETYAPVLLRKRARALEETNPGKIYKTRAEIASGPVQFVSVFSTALIRPWKFAASALAANSVLRSLFGMAFPLFTSYMCANPGIHWARCIPALLALMCLPMPFLFYNIGPNIRKKCKFAAESAALMQKMREGR